MRVVVHSDALEPKELQLIKHVDGQGKASAKIDCGWLRESS
jgi:hypothetical protein